jgi:hypothetical protein
MTPYTTRSRRIKKVLVAGLMTVGAIAGSGCGSRSSDPETAFWAQYIRVMDAARSRGDFYAADAARQIAYLAALESHRWDAMAAVGDASAQLGDEFPRARAGLRPDVQRIYAIALRRAREQGSLDGVLRVSEAFADLGDRDRAREGLLVAADMLAASRDARDVQRLKELAERLEYQASPDSPSDVQTPTATTATWTR